MIEGKLKCGFEISIPDENIDDYELFEDLADIDANPDENAGKVKPAYIRLLGEEQYAALKEHVRKDSGRISRDEMFNILSEIFNMDDESKN